MHKHVERDALLLIRSSAPGVGRGNARAWTPQQERFLQVWWGLRPDAIVAASLGRTVVACNLRAKRHLGISRRDNLLTGRRVGQIFGIDATTTYRLWRRNGWLHPVKSDVGAGGHTTAWSFSQEALRTFVEQYPWAYDPSRMEPSHWLTEFAAVVHGADPWLTMEHAAALACVMPTTIAGWCYKGWLPSQRRPHYGMTAGPHGGHYVVRRSDLTSYLATLPEREWERRSTAVKRWWADRRERAA